MSHPDAPRSKSLSYWLTKRRHKRRRGGHDNKSEPTPIGNVLSILAPALCPQQTSRCPISSRQWQEAVGSRIATKSEPRRIDPDGTLWVTVTTSVWAQELSLLSSAVRECLQRQGHDVKTVRFIVAAVEPPRLGPERFERCYVPPPKPLPPELLQELASIDDEQLRTTIASVIARSLAAQDQR